MGRLDADLVTRCLARSRGQARELIVAGLVRVNGVVITKPSVLVTAEDTLEAPVDAYVSRAAHKLLGVRDELALELSGRTLDGGASTGGFTQVLLEGGAQHVYAVDVGSGQLADRLRNHERVTAWERTNLRDLTLAHVDGRPVDLVVADVSFISLTMVLGPLTSVLLPTGRLILLVKPQFEVGRALLGKGGVVKDPQLHRVAIDHVVAAAARVGWRAGQCVPSPVPGPAGNREFFVSFRAADGGSARG